MFCKFCFVAPLLMLALTLSVAGCSGPVVAGPQADTQEALALREKLTAGGARAEGEKPEDSGTTAGPVEWATLRGVFKYAGQAPTPADIAVTKDQDVCGKHKLVDESLVVGSNSGLADVIVYLRTPKVPVNPDYDKTAKSEVVLDNHDCRFQPHVLAMRTTQTLLLKNSDPVGHNSKIDPTVNAAVNVSLPAGANSAQELPKEETQPAKVGCSIHPWMGGWILIRPDPYAAVSDKKGAFTIENLPAGRTLEFQVWQEKGKLGGLTFQGGKTDTKGRFKIKLKPGDNDLGEIEVSPAAFK